MRLGKQAKNVHLRLGEQEYSGDFTIRTGVGRRSEGGGVKLVLVELCVKTQAWFNEERAAGNFVDRTDLFLEWLHHAKALEKQLLDKKEKSEIAEVPSFLSAEEQEKVSRCGDIPARKFRLS